MVRRVISTLLVLWATVLSLDLSAAISAQLSAQNIGELETVLLTIKVTNTRQSQNLDLTGLEADFHVMNKNTVSQSRFLNGRGQSWVDYQITLQPKRTGILEIPSITVGSDHTPSLELKVQPLSEQTRQTIDELVFFENVVSSNTIYVQSQLILTRRLLYSQGVQLYSGLPGAPEIADAVILSLGETSTGTTERNGRTYGVVEQQYAIFPETSGTFTIPGISITASVRLLEDQRVSRKGVRVGTTQETITVLPVPAAYPVDQPWLPAQNVTLFDVVSPERGEHQVGDTLTHELLVHIEGNIGSMSPPLPLVLDDEEFRIYPQAPVIEDDTNTDTVRGSRLQTISIVPLQPGVQILPITQLVWWDTVNAKVRTSTTKEQTIRISGQAVPIRVVTSPQADATIKSENTALDPLTWPALNPYLIGLLVVAVTLLCLFLLRGSLYHWMRSISGWPLKRGRASLYRRLQDAFTSLDAKQIHAALGVYLAKFYACPRPEALTQFSSLSTRNAAAIDHLNRHLYAAKNDPVHDPVRAPTEDIAATIKVVANAVAELRLSPVKKQDSALPELYPQTV